MKIYTKSGDRGETSLFGGKRVDKDDLQVDAYGTTDETNSLIGLAITETTNSGVKKLLLKIQNDLFVLGGELATSAKPSTDDKHVKIFEDHITQLEKQIDFYEDELKPLKQFILPGGSKSASLLHVARSVCRRSERLVVRLAKNKEINSNIVIYLNRLSDLLFVLARFENNVNQIPDIPWKSK